MRVLFVLPGLHRYDRGAEIAFTSIASELARAGDTVTLFGSGPQRQSTPYWFQQVASIRRERFESLPSIPCLRDETGYEEPMFVPELIRHYQPRGTRLLCCPIPAWRNANSALSLNFPISTRSSKPLGDHDNSHMKRAFTPSGLLRD